MNQFEAFLRKWRLNLEEDWLDFEWVEDSKKTALELDQFFFPGASEFLLPFGRHQSGSFLCYWLNPNIPKDTISYPVAWLDSEGSPIALLAKDWPQFISILPYGMLFLHDLLTAWVRHQGNPERFKHPIKIDQLLYQESALLIQNMDKAQTLYSDCQDQCGPLILEKPIDIIPTVNEMFPEFHKWVSKGLASW